MRTETPRVESLRTVLREYLLALDTGNEFVAELLARCTLDPRPGSAAVLLIPLARLPDRRPTPPDQARARESEQNASHGGQEWRHPGSRELDATAGRS